MSARILNEIRNFIEMNIKNNYQNTWWKTYFYNWKKKEGVLVHWEDLYELVMQQWGLESRVINQKCLGCDQDFAVNLHDRWREEQLCTINPAGTSLVSCFTSVQSGLWSSLLLLLVCIRTTQSEDLKKKHHNWSAVSNSRLLCLELQGRGAKPASPSSGEIVWITSLQAITLKKKTAE